MAEKHVADDAYGILAFKVSTHVGYIASICSRKSVNLVVGFDIGAVATTETVAIRPKTFAMVSVQR